MVKLHFNKPSLEFSEICRTLERPLRSGGRNLKNIAFLYRIGFIKYPVQLAAYGFAVVYRYAALFVFIAPQIPLPGRLDLLDVP
jgi:hypothetical protein